ncbi:ADL046Cp [Eremothecium gossypii ATCC 10895]|uniref:5'-3' exoribonuclease 1 n=1 Tax=Eremothecium gossypii (strain ATCC 10895 / CBS 109.51 / FGSC 9923 / NRRL Y-1056) TaxID=284811 RepID=Q75AG4_EREGS|nr:ADL046Cp [Eremothecium gossypii ATCC 10895]AAS51874.1 ADL046Cp [Eremothecium gossypii ATCC 10895]AEY96172.1 FADL046Cp [Eremothecium gossypii FDAG1]
MGIPKFFRYVSERWPNISQLIDGTQISQFDNLYLDMNSILHTATHGNEDDIKKRLSEEEVFARIFVYIDHLFHTIKPQQTLYMAIDGVAPRAKMNQQRARRFRSAMDAETSLNRARERGDEIPEGEPFDSNSITPGTEFMHKLTTNLKYFIHEKVSSDSLWQNKNIILSGHEVPGEGEHKIMQYIRTLRAQQDYNPNTRHCIYGLDADLIMLGLSIHDTHVALLREEILYGRAQKPKALEQQNFYLLHLAIMREYLELEFQEISDELEFKFDFERLLDDFILVMFVIGNDFLPNLPDLHLNKGAFPVLLQTFKETLKHLDGYINENGTINFARFSVWLDYLSKFELMNFERDDIDVDWFNSQLENISLEGERKRKRIGKKLLLKQQKKIVGAVKPWLMKKFSETLSPDVTEEEITMTPWLEKDLAEKNIDFLKEFALELGLIVVHSDSNDTYTFKIDLDSYSMNQSAEEHQTRVAELRRSIKKFEQAIIINDEEELEEAQEKYNERFIRWKDSYYKEKVGFSIHDEDKLKEMANNYIEGLQWVLYYYYQGCPSWSWYYRYHYAPRISDIRKGLDVNISFSLDQPFKPFQQLMAVLPARSKELLPPVYRPLMYDDKSPILDLYPAEVELDKNGKTADWEAVVKLKFVDQDRLLAAMAPLDDLLTPEEKKRNIVGTDLIFVFNPQVDNVYKSPLKGVFTDIANNHCVEREYVHPSMEGRSILYGLPEGAKLGTSALAGFPTLKSIPFNAQLAYNECTIFNQPSRHHSMLLTIKDVYQSSNLSVNDVAERYLGEIVYSNWPYIRESKMVSIIDNNYVYIASEKCKKSGGTSVVRKPATPEEKKAFSSMVKNIIHGYSKKKGIVLPEVRAIARVLPVTGLIRQPDGSYQKCFSKVEELYPLQLIVEDVENKDERYMERPPLPIDEEFPTGSRVIFLGDYAYGGEATVDGYTSATRLKLTVNKQSTKAEPNIGKRRAEMDRKAVHYWPSFVVAKRLGLHPLFLSRITSRFLIEVDNRSVNVGLMVKFPARDEKVLGYARKNRESWEYSNLTLQLVDQYRKNFPDFFNALMNVDKKIPKLKDLLSRRNAEEASAMLASITAFIKDARQSFVIVPLESDSLTKASIQAVEKEIMRIADLPDQSEKRQLAKVPREAILDPRQSFALLRTQRFDLGDRVIYVQDSGKVPLFSKGTVVGYTTIGSRISIQVLFDQELAAGTTFGERLQTNRGIGVDSSCLLNISKRQFIYHSKASKQYTDKAAKKKQTNVRQPPKITPEQRRKRVEETKKQQAHEMLNRIRNENSSVPDNSNQLSGTNFANGIKGPSIIMNTQVPLNTVGKSVANNVYNAVVSQLANPAMDQNIPFGLQSAHMMANHMPHSGIVPLPPNGMVPMHQPVVFGFPPHGGAPPNMPVSRDFSRPSMVPQAFHVNAIGNITNPPVDEASTAAMKNLIHPQRQDKKEAGRSQYSGRGRKGPYRGNHAKK